MLCELEGGGVCLCFVVFTVDTVEVIPEAV